MITQAFYPVNPPCLCVAVISKYGIFKNLNTSQQTKFVQNQP